MILHRTRMAQIKDFSALDYGNGKGPTDIDGFIDFGGKFFVFIELKFMGTQLPFGQRLALERLSDNSRVPSLVIIAEHSAPVEIDIPVGECLVVEYRLEGKWTLVNEDITVKDFINENTSEEIRN